MHKMRKIFLYILLCCEIPLVADAEASATRGQKRPGLSRVVRQNVSDLGEPGFGGHLAGGILATLNAFAGVIIVVNENGIGGDGVLFTIVASVLAFALVEIYTADIFKGDDGVGGLNQFHVVVSSLSFDVLIIA